MRPGLENWRTLRKLRVVKCLVEVMRTRLKREQSGLEKRDHATVQLTEQFVHLQKCIDFLACLTHSQGPVLIEIVALPGGGGDSPGP